MSNLLPKPIIHFFTKNTDNYMKYIHRLWENMTPLNATEAKAQYLGLLILDLLNIYVYF